MVQALLGKAASHANILSSHHKSRFPKPDTSKMLTYKPQNEPSRTSRPGASVAGAANRPVPPGLPEAIERLFLALPPAQGFQGPPINVEDVIAVLIASTIPPLTTRYADPIVVTASQSVSVETSLPAGSTSKSSGKRKGNESDEEQEGLIIAYEMCFFVILNP